MLGSDEGRAPRAFRGRPLRHQVRACLDQVAASTGLLAWQQRRMRCGLTILMYHRVLPASQCSGYPLDSLVVPVEAFRGQMQWLAQHCDVRPVGLGLRALQESGRKATSGRPLVSVTFDDGYADNFELAAPLLSELGIRGTFFVTTGFVQSGEAMWFDLAADAWARLDEAQRRDLMDQLQAALATNGTQPLQQRAETRVWMERLKRAPEEVRLRMVAAAQSRAAGKFDPKRYAPMTRQQVALLAATGHEIAAHTVTHPILPQLNDQALALELQSSRRTLREWTGGEVNGFCYPNGDVDPRVERAVADTGFQYACVTTPGLNVPGGSSFHLTRLAITMPRTVLANGQHDALGFRAEVCGWREWWRGGRRECVCPGPVDIGDR